MDFFIGDMHFSHTNTLAYDKRPFLTTEANDQALIERWNEAVNVTDHTYIMGDISYANVTKTIDMISQLNGDKTLLVGNHDVKFLKNRDFRNMFREICYYKEVDIDMNKKLVLCHYPIIAFNGQFRGAIHLYAHVHNSPQFAIVENARRVTEKERGIGSCRMYNTGAMLDYMDFTPRTLEEILEACEGNNSYNVLERNVRQV